MITNIGRAEMDAVTTGGGRVLNRGLIEGGIRGNGDAALVITNGGEIRGDVGGFAVRLGESEDRVGNNALISGDVDLGGGADRYSSSPFGIIQGVVFGGAGDDYLRGGRSADVLDGGEDSDILNGGAGDDILTGGAGVDTFVFTDEGGGPGDDRITDYHDGELLDLSAVDADTTTRRDQAFTFIGSNAFSGTAGELRAEAVGSETHVTGDIDGDGLADFTLILQPAALGPLNFDL